jgi:transposase
MWINNYPDLIVETQEQLLEREKSLRGSALENRVKMLRLLKSSAYPSQLRLAKALGYSPRQIRRWWKTYREDGLQALLEDKTHLRWANNKERVSPEALVALEEKMKAGQIARLEEVRVFLEEHFGIHYEGVSGLSRLLKRHQIKLKTGRRRHREASEEEQAAFKK